MLAKAFPPSSVAVYKLFENKRSFRDARGGGLKGVGLFFNTSGIISVAGETTQLDT